MQHLFTCPAYDVLAFRKKQQDILWQHLVQINTPKYIANDIKNGILSLESEAPFVDHTPPTDVALA